MAKIILPSGHAQTIQAPASMVEIENRLGGRATAFQCGMEILLFCGLSQQPLNSLATSYAKMAMFIENACIHGTAIVMTVAEAVQGAIGDFLN